MEGVCVDIETIAMCVSHNFCLAGSISLPMCVCISTHMYVHKIMYEVSRYITKCCQVLNLIGFDLVIPWPPSEYRKTAERCY